LTGSAEDSEKALNEAAGYLRNLIFKKMHIHTVPTLRFKHDVSVERGAEMSLLIDRALQGGGQADAAGAGGDGDGD